MSTAAKAWRLSQLGWTQAEIGERLSVTQSVVSTDIGNSQLGKINNDLGEHWNDKRTAEVFPQLFVVDNKNRYQQLGCVSCESAKGVGGVVAALDLRGVYIVNSCFLL